MERSELPKIACQLQRSLGRTLGRTWNAIKRAAIALSFRHCIPEMGSYSAVPIARIRAGGATLEPGVLHTVLVTGTMSTGAVARHTPSGVTVTSSTHTSFRQKSVVTSVQVAGATSEQSRRRPVTAESGRPWERANATMILRKWLVSVFEVA
jgi:hypothetical protein